MKEEIIKCDYCKEVIKHADYLSMTPNDHFGSVDIVEVGRSTNNLTLSFGDFCGVNCLCNYIRRELGYSAEGIQ